MNTTHITVSGDTYSARELLKAEGFSWDADAKAWSYSDWPGATPEAVRKHLSARGKRFGVYDVSGLVIEVA